MLGFIGHPFNFLFKFNGLLPPEMKQNRFFCIAYELFEDYLFKTAIEECKKKGAKNSALETFNVNFSNLFDLEANITWKIVDSVIVFFLFENTVCAELNLLLYNVIQDLRH
jgi:hypothetical protein